MATVLGPRERSRAGRQPSRPTSRSAQERLRLLARNRVVRIGRSRWTSSSFVLLGLAVLLTVVGLTFVASASSVSSLHKNGDSWAVFAHQLVFVALGLLGLALAAVLPYRIWWKLGPLVFVGSVVATSLATAFGVSKNGSRRWIGFGGQLFQPSEFIKLGSVLFFAMIFSRRVAVRSMGTNHFLKRTLLPVWACAILPIALQPDMGTTVVVVMAIAAVVICGGFPMRKAAPLALGVVTLGALYGWSADYRRQRILTFFHPENDPSGNGWHVTQSKLGFAAGKLFGVGLGASRAKWGWVPNAHTDFVFAIIGEEVGLVGATLVLALFGGIAVVGFSVVNNARDRFGSLVAAGITTWIISQASINMGTVLGVVPVTGVPMPFVSSGGSSFIVLGVAFGILVNISRSQSVRSDADRGS
jgi:cell division protein FtsW